MSSDDKRKRARVAAIRDAETNGGIVREVHVGEPALVGSPPETVLVRVTITMNQGPVRTFNCNVTNEEKTIVAEIIDPRALH